MYMHVWSWCVCTCMYMCICLSVTVGTCTCVILALNCVYTTVAKYGAHVSALISYVSMSVYTFVSENAFLCVLLVLYIVSYVSNYAVFGHHQPDSDSSQPSQNWYMQAGARQFQDQVLRKPTACGKTSQCEQRTSRGTPDAQL